MRKMKSIYQNLGGTIEMPEFRERKLYMHKMSMSEISLPNTFKDYEKTIESVLTKVKDRDNVCYITIDEKRIKSETHRRSGIHCDFNWYENLKSHGEESGGHSGSGVSGGSGGNGGHGGSVGHKIAMSGRWDTGNGGGDWKRKDIEGGGMLLVSNYEGCKVWKGEFYGDIAEGGDCSSIDVSKLQNEIMPSGVVYYLNALGIHESIIIDKEVNRSLIRINFHPDYTFKN